MEMTRKITEKEVSEVMDVISYIYDQIKETRTTCNIIEVSAGEICNLIKCLPEVKDETEVTRPLQEATEADIGKLCVFSLKESAHEIHGGFGILTKINKDEEGQILYLKDIDMWYNSCRRLTKQEIEELC